MLLTFTLLLHSLTTAQAAPLPAHLEEALRANAASCGYQALSSGVAEKYASDDSLRQIGFQRGDKAQSGAISFGGLGAFLSLLSAYTLQQHYLDDALLGRAELSLAYGGSVAGAGVGSWMLVKILDDKKNGFVQERYVTPTEIEQVAGSIARRMASLMDLDVLREDALRNQLVREAQAKVKNHDQSPLNIVDVMQDTKRMGRPAFDETEIEAMRKLTTAAADEESKREISTEQSLKFLSLCRAALEQNCGSMEGQRAQSAQHILANIDRFYSDLRVFEGTQPGVIATPRRDRVDSELQQSSPGDESLGSALGAN